MKNSIYLKNQKRPFSSIGVALPKILPSKIDPEIDPKSSQNRCTCKTKNNDSVREGVTKSIKKPTKIDQKFMQIDQRSVSKSVQNRSQNRSNFGVQKVDTSRTESLFLGTCLSMGTGSALELLHLLKLQKHVRASEDMVERQHTRAIMCMHERT